MRLNNHEAPAQVGGNVQVQTFGMQMNAKMFGILTDKLYNNKEGALIRELAANARDAHVEAGKSDVPFDIKLPTRISPSFYIRDYGTGINPDKFFEIYTNLGYSTKDQEDTSIGAYGLGSKTPLALTDNYVITNYYKGHTYTYAAFKDKGMPSVTLVGERPSENESDGLKIELNVNGMRSSDYYKECRRQLRFFDVKPNILGLDSEYEWYQDITLTDGYALTREGGDAITVIMGGVTYPLSSEGVRRIQSAVPNFSIGYREYLFLEMPLGSIDIPPSRESVELTDRTIEALAEKVKYIMQTYRDTFMKRVASAPTLYECLSHLAERKDSWTRLKITDIMWKHSTYAKLVTSSTEASLHSFRVRSNTGRGWKTGALWSVYTLHSLSRRYSGITVYLNDVSRQTPSIAKAAGVGGNDLIVEPKEYTRGAFKEAADKVGKKLTRLGFTWVALSSLIPEDAPTAKRNTPKSIPDQVFTFDGISIYATEAINDALPTEGYYIPIKGHKPTDGYKDKTVDLWTAYVESKGKQVYGIRNRALKQVEKDGKLVLLDGVSKAAAKWLSTYCKELHQTRFKYDALLTDLANKKLYSEALVGTKYEPYFIYYDVVTKHYADLRGDARYGYREYDKGTYPDPKLPVKEMRIRDLLEDKYGALMNEVRYYSWTDNKAFNQLITLMKEN